MRADRVETWGAESPELSLRIAAAVVSLALFRSPPWRFTVRLAPGVFRAHRRGASPAAVVAGLVEWIKGAPPGETVLEAVRRRAVWVPGKALGVPLERAAACVRVLGPSAASEAVADLVEPFRGSEGGPPSVER